MKRLRFGIDHDGVLSNPWELFINWYNERYQTRFKVEDFLAPDSTAIFGKSIEELSADTASFYDEHGCLNLPPNPGAIEGIQELARIGEIFVVTARPDIFLADSYSWNNRHISNLVREMFLAKCHYRKELTNHRKNKSEICLEREIDLMVDDDINNARYCAEAGVRTLLFDNYKIRNSIDLPTKARVVHSWPEVVAEAKRLVQG